MNKNLLLSLAFGMSAAGAFAADAFTPPFETTTIVGGQFAEGTRWYTLQISSNGYIISNPGNDGAISLARMTTELNDADLWCFVGSAEKGYRIYNKASGAAKVLTAPRTMTGTTGGGSLVTLRDTTEAYASYDATWKFEKSTNLGNDVPAMYMYPVGKTSNAVNNRDGKLSFWTGGKDHGSSLQVKFGMQRMPVRVDNGDLVANGSSAFKKTWTSKQTAPQLVLDAGANNMKAEGNDLSVYVGHAQPRDYVLDAGAGYAVSAFEFDVKNVAAGKGFTIKAGNNTINTSDGVQHLAWTAGDEAGRTAKFTLSGANNGGLLSNFYVTLKRSIVKPEPWVDVFRYDNSTSVPYRIPAIATAKNGTLVAIADHRFSHADIGSGRVDLHISRSTDGGKTWSTPKIMEGVDGKPVAQGIGKDNSANPNTRRNAGYGDPAIVADSESNDMMVLSVSGQTMFWEARRDKPNAVARWYSHDSGATWTKAEDITEKIYTLFDGENNSPRGKVESLFFGSGRIVQSQRVKVGSHYRLYAVVLGMNVNPSLKSNWVLYSDDFGQNWKVLGDPKTPAVSGNADEPKAEELPDGSVLVSSRVGGGRNYNIYRYSNTATGEGRWGAAAFSSLKKASGNACNGEVLVVPVKRKQTGEKLYLALQSIPFGPSGRTNVGINYKPLSTPGDFDTPADFAKNWEGAHESSKLGSAYSTMTLLNDDTVGFLYEEETYRNAGAGGYNIVYKNYSIEQITDSAYTYSPDDNWAVADAIRTRMVEHRAAGLTAGNFVGQYTAEAVQGAQAAEAAYVAAPSADAYDEFNKRVENLPTVELDPSKQYRLRNEGYKSTQGVLYLKANDAGTAFEGTAPLEESDDAFLFSFIPVKDKPGQWMLYNEKTKKYLPKFAGDNHTPALVAEVSKAGVFTLITRTDGHTSLSGVNFTGRPAVHLNSSKHLVPWNIESGASYWMLEATPNPVGVKRAQMQPTAAEKHYDLQGRVAAEGAHGVLVGADGKKIVR